jgi:hypothetical protein
MNKGKTNNSHAQIKALLRMEFAEHGDRVLDVFHGNGLLWDTVKNSVDVMVSGLDKEQYTIGFSLLGDSAKTIPNIEVDSFDIIDFDAYGDPSPYIDLVSRMIATEKKVFFTFIQSMYGGLSIECLAASGISQNMKKTAPALCCRNGFNRFKRYLSTLGVLEVVSINYHRKHYGFFTLPPMKVGQNRHA